jgi:CBS domain containing-hemolysin-like protein
MALLILYLFLALVVSFLCSILEAVLLSVSPSFIKNKVTEGSATALRMRSFKEDIDQPLSAILTMNTISHTVGAAGVGAQATLVFGEAYFGLVSAILTLLILIFSEIIPKTIGATYWRSLFTFAVQLIRWMIILTYPLVFLSKFVTRLLTGKTLTPYIDRQEVSAMADIGTDQGVIEESENKIIQNLLSLNTIKLKEIMTPRTVLVTAPEEMMISDFFAREDFNSFSRIPVYKDEPDNITGFVLKYDVLDRLARDDFDKSLGDIKRPVRMVYENLPVPALFNQLLTRREHFAVLVDEYGGLSGIATMEDIIETILGLEIVDETDHAPNMQELARQQWDQRQDEQQRENAE